MAGRGREGGRGRGSWHHDPQVPAPPQLQMERIDSAGRQQHVALPRPLERGDSGARKRRKDLGGSPGATDRERGGEGRAVPSRGSPTYEPYTGTDSR